MKTVAVLGAGGGGRSAVVELLSAGHKVHLWNRRASTISLATTEGVKYRGVFGEGVAKPQIVTSDLARAIRGTDVVIVCLPSNAHEQLFEDLARLRCRIPLVLNPGHTGGALHAKRVFSRADVELPPLVEFSTLTYVARISEDGTLDTTGRAKVVRAAPLPCGEEALTVASALFPGVSAVPNVLASSLANVNLVLHPPGSVLGMAWAEATSGDFRFYVDAMTPAVGRVLRQLDEERLAVAAAFGLRLLPLLEEMRAIGTADPAAGNDIVEAIRTGEANRMIKAPASTDHRYYREDFPFGLLPFTVLARIARVPVPVAESLLDIAATAIGPDLLEKGRDTSALGLDEVTRDGLVASLQTT